jgi:hypothetical protein
VHLVEKRRRLVDDRRRFSNRLISALKGYFPQAVEWFSHKETFVFCAFITRWPTLKPNFSGSIGRFRPYLPV